MQLLSVSLLFFVAGVLADKKLTYSCYNKTGGVTKTGNNESKAAGTVSDDFADKINDNIGDWSDGKYSAKLTHIRDTITIVCVNKADTKEAALAAIADQQSIVNSHKDD